MADVTVKKNISTLPPNVEIKYKDMGDGTHAEVVYTGSGVVNENAVIFAQAARTASVTSSMQTNSGAVGAYIMIDIAAVTGGTTIEMFVDYYDPAANGYHVLAQSGTLSTVTTYVMLLYPGAVDDDSEISEVVRLPLPLNWRVRVNHSGAGSYTYSVGCAYCGA